MSDSSEDTMFYRAAKACLVVAFYVAPILTLLALNITATTHIADSSWCNDDGAWMFMHFYMNIFIYPISYWLLWDRHLVFKIIAWTLTIPVASIVGLLTILMAKNQGMYCLHHQTFVHHILIIDLTLTAVAIWAFSQSLYFYSVEYLFKGADRSSGSSVSAESV